MGVTKKTMSEKMLLYFMLGTAGIFVAIIIAYMMLRKKMMNKETRYVASLVEGTKESTFSMEIFYQKFYVFCTRIPGIKRYTLKIRRRVDKIDNQILREQINFFAEIRHAYHEYNMVEEAIYEVAQNDEMEVSRQAEKIHEVLISDDPETELEKYYDIAPNSFLKEFAGVSYLTKEFGDRKDKDGASLYLKNLNNITQEMQIEILKRDKLDYVFQSLSMISAIPILFIEVVKNWAIGQFSFTAQFYNGTMGFYMQVALIITTFICYMLTRKLKDNGSVYS